MTGLAEELSARERVAVDRILEIVRPLERMDRMLVLAIAHASTLPIERRLQLAAILVESSEQSLAQIVDQLTGVVR